MKKRLIYLTGILSMALFLFNCDQDTLDTTARPASEIPFINVELEDEQVVSPTDDSGLDPAFATFVGKNVKLSATTPDSETEKRVWFIPQPTGPTDATLNIQEIEDMNPITIQFDRANNTTSDDESSGFPIVLVETLKNGIVNRITTQIQVRNSITADFTAAGVATVNAPTAIRAVSAEAMGLSSTDVRGEGQLTLEWDFGTGVVQSANGPTSVIESDDINAIFNVVYNTITPNGGTGELITLTVTRNYPLRSTSTVSKQIVVVAGLTPDRGDGKDPIKLSAAGNKIKIGYQDAIANASAISGADFDLSIESAEITSASAKAKVDNISVTGIEIDPDNPNNMILTLSSYIPSIVMDNVRLSFTSSALKTQSGLLIDVFSDTKVFPTGENLLAAINASSFENVAQWKEGGYFNPNPPTSEMDYSTERKLDGNRSFLYNTVGTSLSTYPNNFSIGLSIVEGDPLTLPVTTNTQYVLSFWVYVESTDPSTKMTYFLLDFTDYSTDVLLSNLPIGEWVKVHATRNIGPTTDTRSLIRMFDPTAAGGATSGNAKAFIDLAEIRIVDDGR